MKNKDLLVVMEIGACWILSFLGVTWRSCGRWIDAWSALFDDTVNDWLAGWMIGRMIEWLAGWVNDWLGGSMIGWIDDWMNGWMNNWISRNMNYYKIHVFVLEISNVITAFINNEVVVYTICLKHWISVTIWMS